MEFCPDCGSVLLPKNGKLKCSCGYESDLDDKENYKVEGEINPQMEVLVTDKASNAMPTKKITCYKCGGTEGVWWVVQTRSADEAPTYFIRCTNCGNTWRQSN
ncbi:MAG: transcription factor S [Methanobrevibacter sp.]|uniref:transcription factor S n=1 Tax=Methanobrevibacter sp. TaxID=66852 RepID=UPI0026E0DDC6|nr:transcription factor S [Methanobrevibacter sp.]MDO5849403.1 transcription factor S [Methanobrevibacter sp.]